MTVSIVEDLKNHLPYLQKCKHKQLFLDALLSTITKHKNHKLRKKPNKFSGSGKRKTKKYLAHLGELYGRHLIQKHPDLVGGNWFTQAFEDAGKWMSHAASDVGHAVVNAANEINDNIIKPVVNTVGEVAKVGSFIAKPLIKGVIDVGEMIGTDGLGELAVPVINEGIDLGYDWIADGMANYGKGKKIDMSGLGRLYKHELIKHHPELKTKSNWSQFVHALNDNNSGGNRIIGGMNNGENNLDQDTFNQIKRDVITNY